ncbi:MAG TPA: response regulator transcription factor [Pyrinomonadaceae bacterium]|nr:response regulator transcription factor [Pyrinomonadaceae bacterium]
MLSTRVILADDHRLMLDALKKMLEPEFAIVGEFGDGLELIRAAPQLNPHVIVLDIGMPTMNGLTAGQRLKQLMPAVKLIYLTMTQDPDMAAQAFRLGASGYLLKSSAGSELVSAIRSVVRGGSYITPRMTEEIVGSTINHFKNLKNANHLTLRQREVLQLLAEGRSMKEAAFILKVSPRTVAFHKYTMMEHLHIKSTAELVQYALSSRLVAA